MAQKKTYTFGEKKTEYNAKLGKEVDVWLSPKYLEAKAKAVEMLESEMYKDVLTESDFWILQNATKSGKMGYTGLIISHNGCLKINDALPQEKRFRPDCVSVDINGYGGSLVYTYSCEEQGIYEVGEVSAKNCSNAYPYAMALKRLMDRVILKASKLAYSGIYSDSEAEELKEPERTEKKAEAEAEKEEAFTIELPAGAMENPRKALVEYCKAQGIDINEVARIHKLNNTSSAEAFLDALSELVSIYG